MAAKKAKSNITEVESGFVSNWKKENSDRLSDIKRVNEPLFNAIGMALSFINKKLGGTEITMDDIVVESPQIVGKLTDEQLEKGVGVPRFKTEQELTDEYGFAWRDDVFNQFNDDWADELNSVLGEPLEGMQFGLMKTAGSTAETLIFDSNSNTINDIFDGYVRTGIMINGKYIVIYPNIINQSTAEVVESPKRSAIGRWFVSTEYGENTPFQVVSVDVSNPIVSTTGGIDDYWAKINYSIFEPTSIQLENISVIELGKSIKKGELIEIEKPDFLIGEKVRKKNVFAGWHECLILNVYIAIANPKNTSSITKDNIAYKTKDIEKGFIGVYSNKELSALKPVIAAPKEGEWYSIPSGNKLLYIESEDADGYDVSEFSLSQTRGAQVTYDKQSFADGVRDGAYLKRPAPVFKMDTDVLYESSGTAMIEGKVLGYAGWDVLLGYEYWIQEGNTNNFFEKTYDGHNIVLKQSSPAQKPFSEGFYSSANNNVYQISISPSNPKEFISEIWDISGAQAIYSAMRVLELKQNQKLLPIPRAPLFKSGELLYVNGAPIDDDLQHKVLGITYLPSPDTFSYEIALGDTSYWIPEEKLAYTPFNKSNNSVSLETKMPESSSSGNEDIDFDALADELENLDL